MRNNCGGLPSFLRNNFIGNAREQLLLGLKHEGLLSEKEINEAVLQYRMLENQENNKFTTRDFQIDPENHDKTC
jgi:hypothetical protein